MTNQTNLDYLFKLTAQRPERSANGSAAAGDDRPAFDDHLFHASSASLNSSASSGDSPLRSYPSSLHESAARVKEARPDDRDAATDSKTAERQTATEPLGTKNANSPVDGRDDTTQQAVSDTEEKSAGDVASRSDESDAEPDASEELAATALIASQQSAQVSDDQAADDPVVNASETRQLPKSTMFDDPGDQRAGDSRAAELTELRSGNDAAATNREFGGGAHHQVNAQTSDSQTRLGEHANASSAAAVSIADEKPYNEATTGRRSNARVAAVETPSAYVKPAAERAKSKSEDVADSGRESVGESDKRGGEQRRAAGSRAPQQADTNIAQPQATPMAPNAASAPVANSAAPGEATQDAARVAKSVGHSTDGQHLATRSQRTGGATGRRAHGSTPDLPRVDAARFVGRVAKAVQTAQERGGALQLRLSPPELGSLRLELTMQNGVMTAAVETETPAARQVLLDHLPALRERLAEQNIRIERFDVDVRQENSGGQGDPRGSQQEERQHQPQQPNSRHAAGRSAATEPTTNETPMRAHLINSELNLLA